jgi:predicted Zn finger-like uncharacterized protein
MIIVCPSCSSRYSVQPDIVGGGKLVRCAICGMTWKHVAEASTEERRHSFRLIKWTLFWFTVFVMAFSLFFVKNAVMKIWPAATDFYEIVGMDSGSVNKSFIIQNVSNFFVRKDGKLYMGLRGELTNTSNEINELTSIVISLKDETSEKTKPFEKNWTHDLICKKFLPNQKIAFETELQEVPYNNLICDIRLNTL